jgi:hypothetical protein
MVRAARTPGGFPLRRVVTALLGLIAFAGPALAQSASPSSLPLASRYDVSGTNPDGSRYSGTLAIEVISNTTYTVRWDIAGTAYRGFGMRMNDALSATYTLGGQPGLIMYQVRPDGVLGGIWAVRGQSGNGTERATPRH